VGDESDEKAVSWFRVMWAGLMVRMDYEYAPFADDDSMISD
jgi:hypothetical protein